MQRGRQRRLASFVRSESGNVIVIFGLTLPLLVGASGLAIDYGNAVRIRAVEASVADATALLVANADTVAAATEGLRLASAQLTSQLGSVKTTNGFQVNGTWVDGANYRVTISTTVKTSLLHLLPGMPRQITVGTATTVNRVAPVYQTSPPTFSQLSPEAADYNRIYMYCYSSDPKRQAQADKGRRGIVAIADNGTPSTDYSKATLPTCGANEAPSYMLHNVRNARSNKSAWNDTNQETYEYYTDMTIDTGTRVQSVSMKGYRVYNGTTLSPINMVSNPILETIVCDTLSQCKSKSDGGILPNSHTTHNPATATASCSDNKYMYYGWEDRPPNAGSDMDYDDIRVIVSCPTLVKVSDKKLRIVE
ncbi:pilus assembly protein [Methylobacterium sp. WL30]|nr:MULTISPECIES: TadE/TadG family type IV pilus assembly protein [unclassified Methylobacterium]MCJ2009195.1 pilus assembly protein [Methylobacterium sp. J-092]RYF23797.1 MAG: pilus assembly protein [Oxalobacteraceae bacterium]TXN20497.1 pilus assembly protein [Methylobacterium sp. WL93]TXN49854.1 pilus assembly protein [Methylobacterium sp. WL119]TXN62868.1 pilus assembly protein [Methylobacterium sp. WL30]